MPNSGKETNSLLNREAHAAKKHPRQGSDFSLYYSPISFNDVKQKAESLADLIESRFEEIAHTLLEYESYEVVVDEIARTLDILRSLEENETYFKMRVGEITTFLPRNQPLYAFTCFVIVPSLMAGAVHFRIPHSMKHFFPRLLAQLKIQETFPNIFVSHSPRAEFLKERTALRVNPKTKETVPVTDAVIFTGTPLHAEQLRVAFDNRTLFISNGAGHNPIVVSDTANIDDAVQAVLTLQLYNQGQDCAAPNAILVHSAIFTQFLRTLRDEIRTVRVGDYRDRKCRVGPISDPKDLVRVQDFLIDNRKWLDPTTPGIIRAYDAILEPTIIQKPLKEGGNYDEIFAPVMFIQKYESDADLALYFEDALYAPHAMYLTVYGNSDYVDGFVGREINGKILHEKSSLLKNIHLHAEGMERGTQPYGGNGHGASSFSINGVITAKATLPQRDIFEQVTLSFIKGERDTDIAKYTEISHKNVQKLLRTKETESSDQDERISSGPQYIDKELFQDIEKRYLLLKDEEVQRLLAEPNIAYLSELNPQAVEWLRTLRELLKEVAMISLEDFETKLYAIPVEEGMEKKEKRTAQLQFFRHVYRVLIGKDSGPKLAQFLREIDRDHTLALLDY